MFDFHEKRKIREILYSRPVIGVLLVLGILIASSAYNRYEIATETKEKLMTKQAELQSLEERKTTLETQVEYLKNDRGIEEELRDRFDVAKKDEDVVVLIDEHPEDTAKEEQPVKEPPHPSFFERLKFW